ncbi:MAG TPA: hypothetical protein VFX43_19565 [Chitinophagaceae bacterium]|nr:hypothetical protein [Chitinophagaceae bacterium]
MRAYFKFIKTGYIPPGIKSDHISNPSLSPWDLRINQKKKTVNFEAFAYYRKNIQNTGLQMQSILFFT